MGFGHRVYRAEDPRARVLRRTAARSARRARGRRGARAGRARRAPGPQARPRAGHQRRVLVRRGARLRRRPARPVHAAVLLRPHGRLVGAHPRAEARGAPDPPDGEVRRPPAAPAPRPPRARRSAAAARRAIALCASAAASSCPAYGSSTPYSRSPSRSGSSSVRPTTTRGVDDLRDPADDRLRRDGGDAAGERLVDRRAEVDLEVLQRPGAPLQRARPGREHLDDADVREHRLPRQHGQERAQRAAYSRRPRPFDRMGGGDAVLELGEDEVVRGEEALLLVREVVVERAPRHARVGDHVLDPHRGVARAR